MRLRMIDSRFALPATLNVSVRTSRCGDCPLRASPGPSTTREDARRDRAPYRSTAIRTAYAPRVNLSMREPRLADHVASADENTNRASQIIVTTFERESTEKPLRPTRNSGCCR